MFWCASRASTVFSRLCVNRGVVVYCQRGNVPLRGQCRRSHTAMASAPPIVVILGSTGTGKTKLSLELAARYGGEVISADSMQVYTGLDIVTAKATKEEQRQAVHHLLDVARPDQAFTVTHFRERALPIIESLLAANRMPIIVGGTNYYIESILWRVLLSEGVKRERLRSRCATESEPEAKQPKMDGGEAAAAAAASAGTATDLERLLEELPGLGTSESLEAHESELLHQALQRVDPESAERLHPNNKRKIIRALEVYIESGGQCTMSQELAEQRSAPGACGLGGPLRYQNVVIIWLRCDQDILNHRLDARVDSMVAQGLLPEIRAFYESYVKPYDACQFHQGILQAIGFKEFVKYLETYGPEQDLEILDYRTATLEHPRPKPTGLSMLEDCLDYLKLVTRRYARRQLQWIRNRFLSDIGREVPPIYALDTGNVDHWKVQVSDPALAIIDAIKSGQPSPVPCVPKIATDRERLQTERTFRCETCQRVFIGEHQWQIHIHSKKHRKMTKRSKTPSTDQQTGPVPSVANSG
uniref:Uncharacterized protein n=2 Tax=Anopheles arabiensis TaxID=7173 RepID=A0A3F2YSM4_ANOAR